MFFLLGVYLQTAMRYTPIEAGLAMLPVTVLMLLLSERAGALAARIGPRVPMTVGPGIVAVGLLLMARIVPGKSYTAVVLPAAVVFGLGLSFTVAPLTAAVLSAAETRYAGIASGVNNAVARTAQLLAVAVLPVIAGVGDEDYRIPSAFADSFRNAAFITAALAIAGGALAWLTIGREGREVPPSAPPVLATEGQFHCGADAPPLRTR
jgi:fucose permease